MIFFNFEDFRLTSRFYIVSGTIDIRTMSTEIHALLVIRNDRQREGGARQNIETDVKLSYSIDGVVVICGVTYRTRTKRLCGGCLRAREIV